MTRVVNVGGLALGGGNPVLVQSMTNTDTRDAEATLKQVRALHDAGCDIVRVSVYDEACAEAVKVGGLLVYATCTILPAENREVVAAFLKNHPNYEPDNDVEWLPEALRPRLDDGMLQILPHRDNMDGFFIARMRRKRL